MGLRHFGLLALAGLVGGLVALAAPAPPPRPWVDGWKVVDPEKRATFERKGDVLVITVPGKEEEPDAWPTFTDAPRLLREVSGDFVAEVRLSGTFTPAGTLKPAVEAGMVVMGEKPPVARLFRFTYGPYSIDTAMRFGVSSKKNANVLRIHGMDIDEWTPDRIAYLRLGRKGNEVLAAYSTDGKTWHEFRSATETLPAWNLPQTAKLGVYAASSSTEPFKATFDNFKMTRQGQ